MNKGADSAIVAQEMPRGRMQNQMILHCLWLKFEVCVFKFCSNIILHSATSSTIIPRGKIILQSIV